MAELVDNGVLEQEWQETGVQAGKLTQRRLQSGIIVAIGGVMYFWVLGLGDEIGLICYDTKT
jgi:hypothetical protein